MPLVVDGVQGPAVWVGEGFHPLCATGQPDANAECLNIALVNNMPDPAMEDTESQFFQLIDASSGARPVRLKLFSLPQVPRGDRGQQRVDRFYFGINELWNLRFDAVIVTGAEPRHADLRHEPYWSVLAEVLDWAEENTRSAALSCLAAHASVLHSDGIHRTPLGDKRFGVFDFGMVSDHTLTGRIGDRLRFPHSRWNEVSANALSECGYSILTHSEAGGVDLFAKQKRKSLFVHFQGHPEYGRLTLLKEYRRDARRFLRRERNTYPALPKGYFDVEATGLLNGFQQHAASNPSEEIMKSFPEELVARTLRNTWQWSAIRVYRNWLQEVASRKAETVAVPVAPRLQRVPSVASR